MIWYAASSAVAHGLYCPGSLLIPMMKVPPSWIPSVFSVSFGSCVSSAVLLSSLVFAGSSAGFEQPIANEANITNESIKAISLLNFINSSYKIDIYI